MNETELREQLWRAHDAVAAPGGSLVEVAADDVRRGQAAWRRRRAARVGASAAATVVAVTVGTAALSGGLTRGAPVLPGGSGGPRPSGSTSVSLPTTAATPTTTGPTTGPTTVVTTPPRLTTSAYGRRMHTAIAAKAAGSAKYLAEWAGDISGAGIRKGRDHRGIVMFGISVSWGERGSEALGGLVVMARSSGGDSHESIRCGGGYPLTDFTSRDCRMVSRAGGATVLYAENRAVRMASIVYPDGREVSVVAERTQGGNSLSPTKAPLPTKAELIGIVTTPDLAWPGLLVDDQPFGDPATGWPSRP